MTPEQHVDALFDQTAVLVRTLPCLRAIVEQLKGRVTLSMQEALANAEGLDGLGFAFPRRKGSLVDEVIPEASDHADLAPLARSALQGDMRARAEVLDAWQFFGEMCDDMDLPARANYAAEAYLARQLQRLADDEKRRGLVGPASHLVTNIPKLAELARTKGIDVAEVGAEDRWRKRLERHPA